MTKISTVELFPGTPHVFLATPSYDGKVGQAYTVSILHSLAALKEAGFGVTYCLMGGNCHVDDARNGLVREFMMTECTDLVFLDADVGWSGESLVQLLRYDRDMVAGVYPKRVPDGEEYPVKIPPDHALYSEYDGLVEVEAVPTLPAHDPALHRNDDRGTRAAQIRGAERQGRRPPLHHPV